MLQTVVFCFTLAVTAAQVAFPPVSTSCAATLCTQGTVCREVRNPRTGLIQARCEKRPRCGPVCAIYCKYGNVLDYRGCPTCRCRSKPRCGPVCKIYCKYGNVLDSRGCPTCRCRPGPRPKPGRCPVPWVGSAQICRSGCVRDSDCKGPDKCCRTACGARWCTKPVGFPPRPSCNTVRCRPGYRCVLKQVQCFTTPCYPQPTCVPIQPKDGVCPKPNFRQALLSRRHWCRSRCRWDQDCPNFQKCCRVGLRCMSCVNPAPAVTCANVLCQAGYVCVMQQVVCVRAPCFPVPMCVKPECSGGPVVGRCRAAFPRWYYDSATGTCRRFTYGGCGGSSNNYRTEAACLQACDSD